MDKTEKTLVNKCDVCGGSAIVVADRISCPFCEFEKMLDRECDQRNDNLIFANDINKFFKNKYSVLQKGETFELNVPVSRFYKSPKLVPGQINFFKSKNIMFLIEQHGFQFVRRESRFSTTLRLLVKKV